MTITGIKRRVLMFCVNRILPGTLFFSAKRHLLNAAGHAVGPGTRVVGPVFCTGRLITGRDCWVGQDLRIQGNGIVELGDCCDLAPEVTFLTGGHRIGSASRRAGEGETYRIRVEDGCWIGARATVGRNVILGKGSVVAACACVMSDVPANTLVGGVPARCIRKIGNETVIRSQ